MESLIENTLASVVKHTIMDDTVNRTEVISTLNVTDDSSSLPQSTLTNITERQINRTVQLLTLTGSTPFTNLSDTTSTSYPVLERTEVSFSIQDQVIMGAAITVGFLAVLAVVLRFAMPIFRIRLKKNKQKPEIHTQDLYDEKPGDGSVYVPYILSMDSDQSQSSTQSDQSQTSTQSDWSETSSNHTKSTFFSSDSHQMALWKEASFGNLMGSTLSLPVCLPSESGSLSRSHSTEGLNASLMTALSRKTFTEYSGSSILKPGPDTDRGSDIFDDRASTQSVKSSYTDRSISDGRSDGHLDRRSDGLLDRRSDGLLDRRSDGLLDRRSDGLLDRRVTDLNPLFKQCYNNKYKANIAGSKLPEGKVL